MTIRILTVSILTLAAFLAALLYLAVPIRAAEPPAWRAEVMVCWVAMAPGHPPAPRCQGFADTRDPSPSEAACQDRAQEMIRDLGRVLPGPVVRAATRCVPAEPPGTSI